RPEVSPSLAKSIKDFCVDIVGKITATRERTDLPDDQKIQEVRLCLNRLCGMMEEIGGTIPPLPEGLRDEALDKDPPVLDTFVQDMLNATNNVVRWADRENRRWSPAERAETATNRQPEILQFHGEEGGEIKSMPSAAKKTKGPSEQ